GVLRRVDREARGREPHLRARRPGRGDVERVLVAAEGRGGQQPPEHTCPVRADAPAGSGAGAAAEAAGDARPAEDAGGRRQRRLELGRGACLRALARPARRALAPRDLDRLLRTDEGPLSRPFDPRYQLVLAETLPAEAARVDARCRTSSAKPPTLARRFPLHVLGARLYRLAPPLPVLEISTAGPPPFRGYRECSRWPRRTMSA